MAIEKQRKKTLITEFAQNDKDSGSATVQIALLTERINYLTEHFKTHKKDHTSRRGLLVLVGRRRKLINYLKKHQPAKYKEIITKLKLRK